MPRTIKPKHDYFTKRLPEIITQDQADRFWSKVDIKGPDECWPWLASLNHYGYGQFGLDSKRRAVRAPRMAFRLYYGADPFPSDICHRCDNRWCCNPECYFLGTRRDNDRDRDKKGRTARGEKLSPNLKDADIIEIRRRGALGESTYSIAKDYPVSHVQIWHILRRDFWDHI